MNTMSIECGTELYLHRMSRQQLVQLSGPVKFTAPKIQFWSYTAAASARFGERNDPLFSARIPPRMGEIIRVCAAQFHVPEVEIVSHRRHKEAVRARQVAMYLAKKLTMNSLPQIARRIGGRDHTTAIHAVRKIEELLATDAELAKDVSQIRFKLGVV